MTVERSKRRLFLTLTFIVKSILKNLLIRRYKQVEEIAKSNKQQYEYHSDILDKAIEDLNDNDNYSAVPVAPNTQHMNERDIAAKTKPTELFECFDPGSNKQHSQYDLFQDMNILPRNNACR